MKTNFLTQDNLSARLFLFLSRWSLVTVLMLLLTMSLYAGGVGSTATDSVLGPEYSELFQSARSPVFYRLDTLSETFHWLMIGGSLIILAGLFARRAPIRATFIAVCGIAQLTGSLGSLTRATGISDLAARYATAVPNQQAALLQSFLDLNRVIQPHYAAATLLQGAGFLLVAWTAWRWVGFPRWLAVLLAIAGLLGVTLFLLRAAGAPPALLLPVILLDGLGLIGLYAAIAVTSLASIIDNDFENDRPISGHVNLHR
jgi:hypothetical protein